MRIALLSDTHGYLDPKVFKYIEACDQVWHAGDIGTLAVCESLEKVKPVVAVHGNIDGQDIRKIYPKDQRFMCEGVDVWITHIGGYPGRYPPDIKEKITRNPPKLFISGHSHILKVMFDKTLGVLHINPGAAGNHGFHSMKTMVRFVIEKDKIKDLEVIELGPRATII